MRTEKLELVKTRNQETDRRIKARFPIRRELRFKVLHDGNTVASGMGSTQDIGSGGVAFFCDGELKSGAFVELSISWPALLEERCAMRLIVFGRVLRSGGGWSACTIDKYEFRTQGRVVQPTPTVRHDSMLQRWADMRVKEGLKLRAATA